MVPAALVSVVLRGCDARLVGHATAALSVRPHAAPLVPCNQALMWWQAAAPGFQVAVPHWHTEPPGLLFRMLPQEQ